MDDRCPDIVDLDACELSAAIRGRTVSCVEVMDAYLRQVERHNPPVNAIVSLQDGDLLLGQARERDRQLARGEYLGVLHGFPQAVKDLAPTAGIRSTSGSPILADHVPSADAIFVERMRRSGAVVIGKTNVPEFGLGSQTYNPVFGTTGNAYDPRLTAGGSSGGAAVALALRMQAVADGSDFAGSLRNPAAFNNVFGFRPSFGRVPAGPAAEVFLAQGGVEGPMARTVPDLALLLSVMAGPDARFPLGIPEDPSRFLAPLERDLGGTRVAFLGDWGGYLPMEPGVLDLCRAALPAFADVGCVVEEALPAFPVEELWPTWLTWRHSLAGATLHPWYRDPGTRALLKPEAVFEVEGMLRLSALDVWEGSVRRSALYSAVRALLETYEFLLVPAAQVFPFDAGTTWPREVAGVAMDTYHRWMEVVTPWSMTGSPVAAVPVGFDPAGRPMGLQVVGRRGADLDVLRLAHAYDDATRWVRRAPPPALRTQPTQARPAPIQEGTGASSGASAGPAYRTA